MTKIEQAIRDEYTGAVPMVVFNPERPFSEGCECQYCSWVRNRLQEINKEKSVALKSNCKTLQKVADDEPIFVLRAKDRSAIGTIYGWIQLNFDTAPESKLREAEDCIRQMQEWQVENGTKDAD